MMKTDLLFNGYYGYLNTGDDAFVEVASWGAKHIWKKENVRFLIKENKIPETITQIKAFPLSLPKTYAFQQNLLIENTKAFVMAGGSTLNSMVENQPAKFRALTVKNKKSNYKLGAIGVSLGPFKTSYDEKSVINYLKNFDFLALRDNRSYEYAKSLNLPYNPINAFDLAALLPRIYGINGDCINHQDREKKIIGISICNYESYINGGDKANEARRNLQFLKLIKSLDLARTDLHFKFIIINGNNVNGDSKITDWLLKEACLSNSFEIMSYNFNTKMVYEEIAKCDLVLSIRLHAAIFACFGKVPFVLIEYHKKCSDFLNDVGYKQNNRFGDFEIDQQRAFAITNEYLDSRSNFIFPINIDKKIEQAMLNFTEINF